MGCPPSFCNKMGQTALHIGGIWGSIDAVKVLLEAKANVNAQNQLRGSAPLHACAMGRGPADRRAECAKLMIASKADPNMPDLSGERPFEAAADEEVRLALGAAPLVLHKAVQSKTLQTLGDCIEEVRDGRHGIWLDSQNQAGDTALHCAVTACWREGVEMLLRAGANPDVFNYNRRTCLHSAVLQGQHQLVELLLQRKACANTKDVDPDHDPRFKSTSYEETPTEHRTPLHYAAELGSMVCLKLLLEQGRVDVNSRDSKQETPLLLSLGLRERGAQLDVGHGARVDGVQSRPQWNGRFGSLVGSQAKGRWPVLVEGEAEPILLKEANLKPVSDETFDLLTSAGADVNAFSLNRGDSRTILHEAARTGDLALAKRCLEALADLNHQDKKLGLSALHMAARGKHHEMARLLIEGRADVNQTSGTGKTARELASVNGCPEDQLASYGGEETPKAMEVEKKDLPARPQTLQDLTPEQRAQLCID